jgi:hypothetical protein
MPPTGFEPEIPASEQPQTHASNRAATGIGSAYTIGQRIGIIETKDRNAYCNRLYGTFAVKKSAPWVLAPGLNAMCAWDCECVSVRVEAPKVILWEQIHCNIVTLLLLLVTACQRRRAVPVRYKLTYNHTPSLLGYICLQSLGKSRIFYNERTHPFGRMERK